MTLKVTVDKTAQMLKVARKFGKDETLVGIPSNRDVRKSDVEGEEINNAGLGYIHERGSPAAGIPARPFLVPGVVAVQEKVADILGKAAGEAFDKPGALEKGYTRAGIVAQSSVKNTIRKGAGFTPLAESTINQRKRKGFSGVKPLIRTAQLLNAINFVVRPK